LATPGIVQNYNVQTGNGVNLLSWNLSAGATGYVVQRSLDNVTWVTIATVTGTPLATSYLDSAVTLGTQYWYKVAATSTQGSINFTGQPNPGDTVTINTVTYSAVASGATGLEFNIGGTVPATITNLANLINTTIPGEISATATATQLILNSYSSTSTLSSSLTNTTITAFSLGGTSSFTVAQSVVPTTSGEMCLSQIRLATMQRADRVNSNFVTLPEYTTFINLALFELFDLLVAADPDLFITQPVQFTSDGVTYIYNLPDGIATWTSGLNQNAQLVPPPFYRFYGCDLALQNAVNAYVTINKFNFVDRNRFVYPNTSSTIYGVFNLQYRLIGDTQTGKQQIMFIPTPSAGQAIRIWYVPRMTQLLQDTDTTIQGISGWMDYVIVRTAKYVLDKEESDTSKLDTEILFLKGRIEEMAANRDQGIPDKVSDTRANNGAGYGGQGGFGWNGSVGGF
jgi:hypothetical protein